MKDYIKLSEQHFDGQAEVYDANNSMYYSGPAKVSCNDTVKYLKDINYNKLLDVGCGTGYLLNLLSDKKEAEYHGLDLSEGMLKQARAKNIRGTTLVKGRSDELPYEDNYFDVVTCIQSFHHYPDSDKAMQEVYRVLKPGGIYILSDTGVGGIGGWIYNHIIFKLINSGDCHAANKNGISNLMMKNGFDVVENKKLGKFIYTVVGKKLK